MKTHHYPNQIIVFEGIDGTGKSSAAAGVVERLNQRAEEREYPELDDRTIDLISIKVGKSVEESLVGKRFGGAVQLDNFPFPNPISEAVDKSKFEDEHGIDLGAHLYILSALFKDKAILALLPYINVVCDRYVYSLIAKHRALGRNSRFFDYEHLDIVKPDLFYLLKTAESERMRRIMQRGNPTAFDLIPNEPGSRPWLIQREMEKFSPIVIDTTHKNRGEILDRVLADFESLEKDNGNTVNSVTPTKDQSEHSPPSN